MRQLSSAFIDSNLSKSKEPVFVMKILNATTTIYVTSADVTITDPGSVQIQSAVVSAPLKTQKIKPESGFSEIGTGQFTFLDRAGDFTAALNTLDLAADSIYNNRVELYVGYADIFFNDYAPFIPLYVETFDNDEKTYTLTLSDTQRLSKDTLFAEPHTTELVGSYGYSDTTTLGAIAPGGFPLVAHNADWSEDPSVTIGYVRAYGTSADGREVKEIISFTGQTASELTGVRRARFGTERVDLSDEDSSGNPVTVELITSVYIDLVQPVMALALLTGDLYGQPGETLPNGWHLGLDPALVNISSFENIAGTLWQEHVEFRDIDTRDAKPFIAEQVLARYGTLLRINQFGEYALTLYDFTSQLSAGDVTLEYSDIRVNGPVRRSVKDIVNYFRINWGYRPAGEYYARSDYYVDGNSQTKFKYKSPLKVINMRGLRNRDTTSKPMLDFIAQSQVKRFSNPSVRMSVTAKLSSAIELEVGDRLTLLLPNVPDFQTLDSYQATFEVQGMRVDFLGNEVTLDLFSSEGTPSDFTVKHGENVVDIDTSAWTDLNGSPYGIVNAGVFEFSNGASLPDGKFFYAGNVEVPDGVTISGSRSLYLDCANFYMGANAKIDLKAKGFPGLPGYFGLGNTAQGGMETYDPGAFKGADRIYYRGGESAVAGGRVWVDLPDILRIADGQDIAPLVPMQLNGHGGGKGGDNVLNGLASPVGSQTGGAPVSGGGGIFISCDAMQYETSAEIDVSGADNNVGGFAYQTIPGGSSFDQYFHAGSSGHGWPGVCIVALKDRQAVKPFLYDLVTAKTGAWAESPDQATPLPGGYGAKTKTVTGGSKDYRKISVSVGDYRPFASGTSFAGTDYATESNRSAIKVTRLVVSEDYVPEIGVDDVDTARAVSLALVELINTPREPLGDRSTIEITATPAVGDSAFRYVKFDYRLQGRSQWVPVAYDVSTKATFTVTSSGDTYEIRATSYNAADVPGGVAETSVTVATVTADEGTSDGTGPGAPVDLKLPDISGLKLINRVAESGPGLTQFKSGNAEFVWNKIASTVPSGANTVIVDPHFSTFKVVIKDLTNTVMRTEYTRDSFYTYTLEQNRKDSCGRTVTIEVSAIATTAYETPVATLTTDNPQPAAPAGVTTREGVNSVVVTFTLPEDLDFVGTDFYIIAGAGNPFLASPTRISGNEITRGGLANDTLYTYGLTSVDQFGPGGSTSSFSFTTLTIDAGDVSGLGAWSGIDQADLTFINTPGEGIADGAIQSAKIVDLVASKIKAGSLLATEWVQVGLDSAGVRIDGASGTILSKNSNYNIVMGATLVPAQSANPLVLFANDGASYPVWIDSLGHFKFGAGSDNFVSFNGSKFVIDTDNFSVDAGGNATLSGSVTITSGSGISNLSDAGALATQSSADFSTQVTGATKPANNATVGATWGTNIGNEPNQLGDINGTEGTKLTGISAGADVTQAALTVGTTLGAGFLHLTGGTANIAIGDTTFGDEGIQLQYNSGLPRMYIGDGTEEGGMTFTLDGFHVGDDVGLVGVDGYTNFAEAYYHLYGHQIYGGIISTGAGAIVIAQNAAKTTVKFDGTVSQYHVASLNLEDGGNDISFNTDFAFKVAFRIFDYNTTSQNGNIEIGFAMDDFVHTSGSKGAYCELDINRDDANNYNFRFRGYTGSTGGSAFSGAQVIVPDDDVYQLEVKYVSGLLSVTAYAKSADTTYALYPATAVTFDAGDVIRNQLLCSGFIVPAQSPDGITFSLYDLKIKGTRLP